MPYRQRKLTDMPSSRLTTPSGYEVQVSEKATPMVSAPTSSGPNPRVGSA